MYDKKRKNTGRSRFFAVLLLSAIFISFISRQTLAYTTDTNIYAPPNYSSLHPPPVNGSDIDPLCGTAIKRLSNAINMNRTDTGGTLIHVSAQYPTMPPCTQ